MQVIFLCAPRSVLENVFIASAMQILRISMQTQIPFRKEEGVKSVLLAVRSIVKEVAAARATFTMLKLKPLEVWQ